MSLAMGRLILRFKQKESKSTLNREMKEEIEFLSRRVSYRTEKVELIRINQERAEQEAINEILREVNSNIRARLREHSDAIRGMTLYISNYP